MDQYNSEEHGSRVDTSNGQVVRSSQKHKVSIPLIWIIVVVIVGVLCFFGGVSYGKDHAKKSTTAMSMRGMGPNGRGFSDRRDMGTIGTVTAVSSTSITVEGQQSGTTSTYNITSATTITDNGQTITYSDIQTGDTVMITKTSQSSSDASKILVNPSFGGGLSNSND